MSNMIPYTDDPTVITRNLDYNTILGNYKRFQKLVETGLQQTTLLNNDKTYYSI